MSADFELTLAEKNESVVLEMYHKAWRQGWALEALLDKAGPTGGQLAWVHKFWDGAPIPAVWNVGRQRGKTWGACVLAADFASRTKDAIIRYCGRTKDSAFAIVEPTMRQIIATMPPEMAPTKGRTEYEWHFPRTNATFVLFGTDAQSFSRGRGPRTHLQLFDEYAFFQELEEVENALMPSLQTTGGRVLYLSSPPSSMAHPATVRIQTAMLNGRCITDTFWNNPRVNHEEILNSECARLGLSREQLLKSTAFRREYLAELVGHDGAYFNSEWFAGKIIDELPSDMQWVRSWDTAATEASGSNNPDWTVGVKLGIQHLPSKERRVVIADVKRFRKGPGETEREMHLTAELDGQNVPIILEQEPGSAGKIMVHGNKTRVFFGHTVHAGRRTGNKASYWSQLATQAEVGNVLLLRGAWNDEFVRELCALPVGHDDQADAAAFGFSWLATHSSTERIQTEAVKPTAVSKMRSMGM